MHEIDTIKARHSELDDAELEHLETQERLDAETAELDAQDEPTCGPTLAAADAALADAAGDRRRGDRRGDLAQRDCPADGDSRGPARPVRGAARRRSAASRSPGSTDASARAAISTSRPPRSTHSRPRRPSSSPSARSAGDLVVCRSLRSELRPLTRALASARCSSGTSPPPWRRCGSCSATPAFDYRLLLVGSVLPLADAVTGGVWVMHSITFSVALVVVVMVATIGRRAGGGGSCRCRSARCCTSCSAARGPTPTCSGGRSADRRSTTPRCRWLDRGWGWSIALEVLGPDRDLALGRPCRIWRTAGVSRDAACRHRQFATTRSARLCGSLTAVLILVRHGRTPANAAGLLQGRLDQDLDELGERQAVAVAKMIGPVDEVISSPLRRARATAEAFGLPVEIDERWIELSLRRVRGQAVQRRSSATCGGAGYDDPAYAPAGRRVAASNSTSVCVKRSASWPTWLAIVTWSSSPTSRRSRPPSPGCCTPTSTSPSARICPTPRSAASSSVRSARCCTRSTRRRRTTRRPFRGTAVAGDGSSLPRCVQSWKNGADEGQRMIFTQHYLACLSHASYLIGDETTGRAVVVDPRRDVGVYLDEAAAAGLTIERVIETHCPRRLPQRSSRARGRDGRRHLVRRGAPRSSSRSSLSPTVSACRSATSRSRSWRPPGTRPSRSASSCTSTPTTTCPYGVLTGDTLFVGDVGRPDLLASRRATVGRRAGPPAVPLAARQAAPAPRRDAGVPGSRGRLVVRPAAVERDELDDRRAAANELRAAADGRGRVRRRSSPRASRRGRRTSSSTRSATGRCHRCSTRTPPPPLTVDEVLAGGPTGRCCSTPASRPTSPPAICAARSTSVSRAGSPNGPAMCCTRPRHRPRRRSGDCAVEAKVRLGRVGYDRVVGQLDDPAEHVRRPDRS